jgi:hypothetical protein
MFAMFMSIVYRQKYSRILSQKKSSEVRIGQIAEHFSPFLNQFNHDPKQARFIGMPIDFVVFEDTGIYFVEIKTGAARLSTNQNKYKKLVEEGKIFWEEIKIQPDGVKTTSTYKLDTVTGRYNSEAFHSHPDLYPDITNTPLQSVPEK